MTPGGWPQRAIGTWLLIIVSGVLFAVDLATGRSLLELGAKSAQIWSGELHRLVLPTFLHADIRHILFNMYALLIFGQIVEGILGTRRFLVLYLVGGAVGYIASLLWLPGVPAVGASASVFALMGFTLHYRLRREPLRWLPLDTAFAQIFILNGLIAWFIPNVDHLAHAGGLVGGMLCGSLLGLGRQSKTQGPTRREAATAALVLALILYVGLQPLAIAQLIDRIDPISAQRIDHHFRGYFLAYQASGAVLLWRYADEQDDWNFDGDHFRVDPERPVQLGIFWRWEPGARYEPEARLDYTITWQQDGETVQQAPGVATAVEADRNLVYLRSYTPVLSGQEFTGAWTVTADALEGRFVTLRARISSTR